jgi:hypothetical protein
MHANKLLLLAAVALTAAAVALPASIAAAGTPPVSPLISRVVTGCGGKPLTVWSPRTSGAPLDGQALGFPDGPGSLLAQASALHVTWLSTITCVPTHQYMNALNTTNWTGWADTPSQPVGYVQAEYHIPSAGDPLYAGTVDYSSAWSGMGDLDHIGDLIQDGTEQDSRCVVSHGKCARQDPFYLYWIEVFPYTEAEEVANLTAVPAHLAGASVNWTSANKAAFLLCDYTARKCVLGSLPYPRPADNSAEWIVERTSLCVDKKWVEQRLARYGQVNWTNAGYIAATSGNPYYPVSAGNPLRVTMVTGTKPNHAMSVTGGLSKRAADSFRSTWLRFGPLTKVNESCG